MFHNSSFAAHIRSLSINQINEVQSEMETVNEIRTAGVHWDWVKLYVSGECSLTNIPFEHQHAKGGLDLCI